MKIEDLDFVLENPKGYKHGYDLGTAATRLCLAKGSWMIKAQKCSLYVLQTLREEDPNKVEVSSKGLLVPQGTSLRFETDETLRLFVKKYDTGLVPVRANVSIGKPQYAKCEPRDSIGRSVVTFLSRLSPHHIPSTAQMREAQELIRQLMTIIDLKEPK